MLWRYVRSLPVTGKPKLEQGIYVKMLKVVIEDWDGAIRIPDEALQELDVDVGASLYLVEEYVGSTRCLVLSKTERIPDRVHELVGRWDNVGKAQNAKDD